MKREEAFMMGVGTILLILLVMFGIYYTFKEIKIFTGGDERLNKIERRLDNIEKKQEER